MNRIHHDFHNRLPWIPTYRSVDGHHNPWNRTICHWDNNWERGESKKKTNFHFSSITECQEPQHSSPPRKRNTRQKRVSLHLKWFIVNSVSFKWMAFEFSIQRGKMIELAKNMLMKRDTECQSLGVSFLIEVTKFHYAKMTPHAHLWKNSVNDSDPNT